MRTKAHSNSPGETFKTGQELGKKLDGREIILLVGELGAGKTLLTKGIAAALDIDPDEVVSPTFTIMNRYEGKFRLYHIDLYRLGEDINVSHGARQEKTPAARSTDKSSAHLPEIDDNIDEGVIVIEWAQFLPRQYFVLNNAIRVEMDVLSENSRLISIAWHRKSSSYV